MLRNVKTTILLVATLLVAGCANSDYMGPRYPKFRQNQPRARADIRPAMEPRILPETYMAAAKLFEQQGNYEQAIKQYRMAVAVNHDYAAAYHRLGVLLSGVGHYIESVEALDRAAALRPDNPVVQNNLAFVLMLQGKWAKAEQHLRAAIDTQPWFVRAQINLGMTLAQLGRRDEALDTFRKVLPETDAYYNFGLMLRSTQNYDEAAEAFRHALSLNPEFSAAARQLDQIAHHLTPAEPKETEEPAEPDDFAREKMAEVQEPSEQTVAPETVAVAPPTTVQRQKAEPTASAQKEQPTPEAPAKTVVATTVGEDRSFEDRRPADSARKTEVATKAPKPVQPQKNTAPAIPTTAAGTPATLDTAGDSAVVNTMIDAVYPGLIRETDDPEMVSLSPPTPQTEETPAGRAEPDEPRLIAEQVAEPEKDPCEIDTVVVLGEPYYDPPAVEPKQQDSQVTTAVTPTKPARTAPPPSEPVAESTPGFKPRAVETPRPSEDEEQPCEIDTVVVLGEPYYEKPAVAVKQPAKAEAPVQPNGNEDVMDRYDCETVIDTLALLIAGFPGDIYLWDNLDWDLADAVEATQTPNAATITLVHETWEEPIDAKASPATTSPVHVTKATPNTRQDKYRALDHQLTLVREEIRCWDETIAEEHPDLVLVEAIEPTPVSRPLPPFDVNAEMTPPFPPIDMFPYLAATRRFPLILDPAQLTFDMTEQLDSPAVAKTTPEKTEKPTTKPPQQPEQAPVLVRELLPEPAEKEEGKTEKETTKKLRKPTAQNGAADWRAMFGELADQLSIAENEVRCVLATGIEL